MAAFFKRANRREVESGRHGLPSSAAMIYQHATDPRDRVIADALGDAIDQWQAERDDDGGDDGTGGVPVPA